MIQWLARLFGSRPPVRRVGEVDWAASGADAISQPLAGPENMVWWPYPHTPGKQALVFRGSGNAETGEFTLDGEAALRIVMEAGPYTLRIRRADGTFLHQVPKDSKGGLALTEINEGGGTYSLVIETPARWEVTIVYPATQRSA
jgi:hypothetical protein